MNDDSYILQIAMSSLQRIARTQITRHEANDSCRCPKCEATDAVQRIREIYRNQMSKDGAR